MPSLECDCFLRSCSVRRLGVHRCPGAIQAGSVAVWPVVVVGVDKRK